MDVKQVIVIRKDLKMRRGKEIAQGAHASMAWITNRMEPEPHTVDGGEMCNCNVLMLQHEVDWCKGSFTKVTLQVNTEAELMDVYHTARARGLMVHLIIDSGKTEFDGEPTKTCLAIGPNDSYKIDLVTKNLKLY